MLERRLQCLQNIIYTFHCLETWQFINQSRDKTILICIHLKSKCVSCGISYSANETLTWTWPGFCLSTNTHRERESVLGITRSLLSEGFPQVWKQQICLTVIVVKLKLECVFWHLLSESNFPAIVAIFSWKGQKGKSVRMLAPDSRSPKICVCMCVGRPPYLFPLVERWRWCSAWLLCLSSFSLVKAQSH